MTRLTLQRIGPLLRERRGDRGIREVAREIGVSPATLSRIERGKVPDLETFSKVCTWLRIDPGEILGRSAAGASSSRPSEPIPAVHFKADRAISPKAARALADMILAAQKMMAT